MAKLNSNVDKEELKKDIEALKNAKNDEEVDAILAKYQDALNEVEAKKAEPVEEAPAKAPAKKPAAKKATTKKAAEKKPAEKKETAKKTTTKTAAKKTTAKDDKPKGRSYNGKYEVYEIGDGFQYHLKASNGEILFVSEVYTSREGVSKAIDALKRNIETGELRITKDKKERFKFKLISKNYRVLAISSSYPQESGAVRASESFKKFAVKADIVDIDYQDADLKTATPIKINKDEDKDGGKFEIEKYDGEYSWDLKASNGQILCQADGYTSKAGVLNSIESFKKNAVEGTFKAVKDKNGQYCYKLYTPAGRVCAVGESYTTKGSAESAANSVVSFIALAETVEIKD